ncbi:dTDP-L-rhamnose 4-epimerase [Microbacterium endophyticum]|uniref:dTDP-L-rhamnose 4-epimerase n=1 Tax=Microbacterium endophyticum TaxID=1526412 RepID=A0A7W4V0X7_9MICO|nr:NAD-dependent epimerase/dehydratase family protein [Microbacterium endophyticum]MBB2974509.1 dTDP-L-rhamnose 4-epimerase [Microbacterium endophyticum]NIK36806.1 dTDP-L-rhamnose 4-epimerase [Microbacterium endophyticum]
MPAMLITGGAGFIGSRLHQDAASAGWSVRILDSLRADVHGYPAAGRADSVNFVHGDVNDPETLDRALEGIDVVSHQAAKVGLGVDLDDAPDYVRSNVLGTAELLAAMRRQQVSRLVLASSMVIYGEGAYRTGTSGKSARPAPRRVSDLEAGGFDPFDADSGDVLVPELLFEDAPSDPRNVYATTKLAQENLAASWARETGGRAAILRYHNVYGPGMPRDTPYAGVASLFRSALERGEEPRVFEDGAQRRDFVHVADVAAANMAAVTWTANEEAGSVRAFNVGSGRVTTISEMAHALSDAFGGPAPVITGQYRLGDVRHITASSQRAAEELNWRAAVPFHDGMREFATAPLRTSGK